MLRDPWGIALQLVKRADPMLAPRMSGVRYSRPVRLIVHIDEAPVPVDRDERVGNALEDVEGPIARAAPIIGSALLRLSGVIKP